MPASDVVNIRRRRQQNESRLKNNTW